MESMFIFFMILVKLLQSVLSNITITRAIFCEHSLIKGAKNSLATVTTSGHIQGSINFQLMLPVKTTGI